MISLTLGCMIILGVSQMVIASQSAQINQSESSYVQDTARFALDNITRAVRQAGYVNYHSTTIDYTTLPTLSPSVYGLDNSELNATSDGIDSPRPSKVNSSDVLALRYFGSGANKSDYTVLNCAGFGVAEPTSSKEMDQERGWSIYYVGIDETGESNLYCKYKGNNFTAQTIARGVDSFQVLYGLDISDPVDGVPNKFLNASAIDAMDATIPVEQRSVKSYWKKVVAVQVALLIHGDAAARIDSSPTKYFLHGAAYSASSGDPGTIIDERGMQGTMKAKYRKLFRTTIALRNAEQ